MQTETYGSWKSPLGPMLVAEGERGLEQLAAVGGKLYWLEARDGRNVPFEYAGGKLRELVPAGFNLRSRVHEYGGSCFLATEETFYFVNFADQQIYSLSLTFGGLPKQLTREPEIRFADLQLDAGRGRLLAVAERHAEQLPEPENFLAAIDLASGAVSCITAGEDFYSSPRLSPDGTRLAFISWQHPNMPWDETRLWLKDLASGEETLVPGQGAARIQPGFDRQGRLIFSSDENNWWNLYRFAGQNKPLVQLTCLDAEIGAPHWVFGQQNHFFLPDGRMLLLAGRRARDELMLLDGGEPQLIDQPFSSIRSIAVLDNARIAMIASAPHCLAKVVELNLADGSIADIADPTPKKVSLALQKAGISEPETLEFATSGGQTAHGFFYPPANAGYKGPDGSLPPLIVKLHGGPTSHTDTGQRLLIQYWTSRGFALLDVNHRGSTGYGRDYRRQLYGQWGLLDLDDAEAGVQHLIQTGRVDPEQIIIRGGSAGGFSTLAALTFRSSFRAGASYYGISDLTALAEDTHKFESRYLDQLVGPWPEARDVYLARSPLQHLAQLKRPVIFFQGLDDKVVPPNQTRMMVDALKKKGSPVACLEFPGEGHGFRQPENQRRALDAELSFYGQVFGFTPGDDLPAVAIEGLAPAGGAESE